MKVTGGAAGYVRRSTPPIAVLSSKAGMSPEDTPSARIRESASGAWLESIAESIVLSSADARWKDAEELTTVSYMPLIVGGRMTSPVEQMDSSYEATG